MKALLKTLNFSPEWFYYTFVIIEINLCLSGKYGINYVDFLIILIFWTNHRTYGKKIWCKKFSSERKTGDKKIPQFRYDKISFEVAI